MQKVWRQQEATWLNDYELVLPDKCEGMFTMAAVRRSTVALDHHTRKRFSHTYMGVYALVRCTCLVVAHMCRLREGVRCVVTVYECRCTGMLIPTAFQYTRNTSTRGDAASLLHSVCSCCGWLQGSLHEP